MNTEWLKARQTKYAAYVTIYILVILAVLVVANYPREPLQQVLRRHRQQAVHAFPIRPRRWLGT